MIGHDMDLNDWKKNTHTHIAILFLLHMERMNQIEKQNKKKNRHEWLSSSLYAERTYKTALPVA